MRTHSQIIRDAGGPGPIRELLHQHGFDLTDPAVRSWLRRPNPAGSIPPAYWPTLAKARIATLKELADHAEALARGTVP
jgi:hypothetical protein